MIGNTHLDNLKTHLNLPSDAKLADYLSISRGFLSQVRKGERTLPFKTQIRVADALGFVYTAESILNFLPDEMADLLIEKIQNQAAHIAENNRNVGQDADDN